MLAEVNSTFFSVLSPPSASSLKGQHLPTQHLATVFQGSRVGGMQYGLPGVRRFSPRPSVVHSWASTFALEFRRVEILSLEEESRKD